MAHNKMTPFQEIGSIYLQNLQEQVQSPEMTNWTLDISHFGWPATCTHEFFEQKNEESVHSKGLATRSVHVKYLCMRRRQCTFLQSSEVSADPLITPRQCFENQTEHY